MENGPGLKMYFLLKMVIFHCYVSLPEGDTVAFLVSKDLWFVCIKGSTRSSRDDALGEA